jgi:hypothetical protein
MALYRLSPMRHIQNARLLSATNLCQKVILPPHACNNTMVMSKINSSAETLLCEVRKLNYGRNFLLYRVAKGTTDRNGGAAEVEK